MKYKKCNQSQCCFLIQFPEGCPECPECGAKPHELSGDGNCVNCHCCEGDEGYIRKGDVIKECVVKQGQKIMIKIGGKV